jgi:hypothetical protein
MPIVIPNEAAVVNLNMIFQRGSQYVLHTRGGTAYYYCGLYKTNITLGNSTTWAGSVVEADFPGYAEVEVTTPWLAPSASSGLGTIVGPNAVFTCTGGGSSQTIYGCFLKYFDSGLSTNLLLAIQAFASPVTVVNNGDAITINCQYELEQI